MGVVSAFQSVEKRRVHAFYQVTMGSKNGKPVLTEDQAEALAQSSGLTVDQVKEQFEAFKTEHPNGKMKRKDFKEMMSKALPKKDADKMEKHVFRYEDEEEDSADPEIIMEPFNGNECTFSIKLDRKIIFKSLNMKNAMLGFVSLIYVAN